MTARFGTAIHDLAGYLRYEARVGLRLLRSRKQQYDLIKETGIEGVGIGTSARLVKDGTSELTIQPGAMIGDCTYLYAVEGGCLYIGRDVFINECNNIRAAAGEIRIGDRTIIAQYVSIIAANHAIPAAGSRIGEAEHDRSRSGVIIGADVWIGAGAVILPGVQIGNGAVVGAGAVVTRSIPDNAVAVGNPARVVRTRDESWQRQLT